MTGEPPEAGRLTPAQPRSRRGRAPRNTDSTAATRVDILKSAAKAFRRRGYHGATVENIAAALRMKKGNLYYYFKNKEEILFGCRTGAKASRAHRRDRTHDPRRAARHRVDSGARSALTQPLQNGRRAPRSVRSRNPAGAGGRHRGRLVFATRRQASGACAARGGELDSALVQSRGAGDFQRDRR